MRFTALLLLVLCSSSLGCLFSSGDCGPADYPQACDGYAVEFTVNDEKRRERDSLGAFFHDNALPEKRHYSVGLLSQLGLSFPKSEVGVYTTQMFGDRVDITYDNGGSYRTRGSTCQGTVEIVGLTDRTLWGRFEGQLCHPYLSTGVSKPLNISGRFTAQREDY